MSINLGFIRNKIEKRPVLQKIIFNTGWLTFEKLFRMALALLVSVLLARHLGPTQFGILSYAISLIGFAGTFIYLGLSGLVIRDIVNNPEQKYSILGTTFAIKMIGTIFAYLIIVFISVYGHSRSNEFWVLLCVGLGLFFRPFETIDYWFHSQTISKFSVYSNGLSYLFISIINIFLVFIDAPLIFFAVSNSLEVAMSAGLLIVFYHRNNQSIFLWKAYINKAKELIGQSWILILSGFFSVVYLKIDQIMLRWMIGPSEVGVYSVAVNFSEVWYFLPTAIALSVYPTLIESKNKNPNGYKSKIQKSFDTLYLISLSVAIIVTLVSKPAIDFLYGEAYSKSGSILMIHIWAGVFIFMRALFSRIILIENLLFFSLFTNCAGAAVNVVLNFLLIKMYAGYGAAVATLLSYATASYFSLFLYTQTRPYAVMMSHSILLPIRFIFKRQKIQSTP